VAAETAIVSSQVERRRAPNLFNSVSSQPTPRTGKPGASYIVRILQRNKNKDKYMLEWSESPGERGFWESKKWIENQPNGAALIAAYEVESQASRIDVTDDS
jgi:hypothetical protein